MTTYTIQPPSPKSLPEIQVWGSGEGGGNGDHTTMLLQLPDPVRPPITKAFTIYADDPGFMDGTVWDTPNGKQRFGMSGVTLDTGVGSARITLTMSEEYDKITQAGQRVFDVSTQTKYAAAVGVDVFKASGFGKPYEVSFAVDSDDAGKVRLDWLKKVDNPIIDYILVEPSQAVVTEPDWKAIALKVKADAQAIVDSVPTG